MAGLLVTLGNEAQADHKGCFQEFAKAKGLTISHRETRNDFCLTKFSRKNGRDDNVLLTDDIKIWAVGTLIYKNLLGKAALIAFKEDLCGDQIGNLVRQLDGSFCLIIERSIESGFWIITDHAGILNVYKYYDGNTLAFSTSALVLSRTFPVTPNNEGVTQFLRSGSICDSKTIYNEIELLEPASIYYVQYKPDAKIESKTAYWKSPIQVMEDMSFQEAKDLLANSLLDRISVVSGATDENIICDLTAGFDTRLVIASFLSETRSHQGNIHTFVFGPDVSSEVNLVKEYSKRLGFKNIHLTVPDDWDGRFYDYVIKALELTDGEENVCNYAPILLAQEYKSKHYTYSVNGLGGELYRDFWWVQEFFYRKKPANFDRLINMRILQYEYDYSIFSDEWKSKFLELKQMLKRIYEQTTSDMDIFKTYNTLQIDNIYLRQKIRKWAGRTISTSNQLIRTVAPLVFKKCLEAGMVIPPKFKRNGRLVKAVVEAFSPVLAEQRMLNGSPCQNFRINNFYKFSPFAYEMGKKMLRKITQAILHRTILLDKSLTFDTSNWFHSMLSDERCRKILSYEKMCTQKLYCRDKLETFMNDSKQPGFRYYQQLGNILTLELRMREDRLETS